MMPTATTETPPQRFFREIKAEEARLGLQAILVHWKGSPNALAGNGSDEEEKTTKTPREYNGPPYEELLKSKVIFIKAETLDRIEAYVRNIQNTEYRFDSFTPARLDILHRQLKWTEQERAQVEARQAQMSPFSDEAAHDSEEEDENFTHGTMFNTHSSFLMMVYIEKELKCIQTMFLKTKATASKPRPLFTLEDCFDELLALTFAVKAVTHWHEDCDDASFNIDIAKLFSTLWNKALRYENEQLGITPGSRDAVMLLLQQVSDCWAESPASYDSSDFRLKVKGIAWKLRR